MEDDACFRVVGSPEKIALKKITFLFCKMLCSSLIPTCKCAFNGDVLLNKVILSREN